MNGANPFPWIQGGEAWKAISGREIALEAASWVGTPFALHQRAKGAGVDCFGLIVGTLAALGVEVYDELDYTGQTDELGRMVNSLWRFADSEDLEDEQPGDFLVFRCDSHLGLSRIYNHSAIQGLEGTIIHASPRPCFQAVIQHPLDKFWAAALVGRFRYRGSV